MLSFLQTCSQGNNHVMMASWDSTAGGGTTGLHSQQAVQQRLNFRLRRHFRPALRHGGHQGQLEGRLQQERRVGPRHQGEGPHADLYC